MKKTFKKLKEKVSEAWYAALPWLILLGIPLTICLIIKIVDIYPKLPRIIAHITELGNGSIWKGVAKALAYIALTILAAIGAFNTFVAFCTAIEELKKKISERWLKVYVIFSILGIVAMIFLGIINVQM